MSCYTRVKSEGMNAIPGKRLTSVALYEFTSLFVTSYWKFMRAGYRREQRTRRALDRSGLFVSRGRGYAFRGREGKREKLSIAPIKKLPSLSFGPVLYYVQHKVHCSFSLLFPLSLSFSRGQGMPPPSGKEILSICGRNDRNRREERV